MRQPGITVEVIIGGLASTAFGLVRRRDLLEAGITAAQIRSRLASGFLLREYPGVYRVGHRAPSTEARYLAAVWACGEGAVLSGGAGGHLLGLLNGMPPVPEVTAPVVHRIPGLTTHRSKRLSGAEVMVWRSIPVTSVARTLVDLAARLPRDRLARAYHEADVKHRITPDLVEVVLANYPHARGAGKLRAVIYGDVRVTLSRLEARFLEILREDRLPVPVTNRPAGGRRVDCRWPEHKLTVELDSYRYHGSRHAWESDRRREREAYVRGDQFRRYTWADVFEDTTLMRRELADLLRRDA